LLETVGPASVDDLATELKLTDRMVRYDLASVDSVLTAVAFHGTINSSRIRPLVAG
jgi:transcriptional antiterminator